MITVLFITDNTTGKQYVCKKWKANFEKSHSIFLTICEKEEVNHTNELDGILEISYKGEELQEWRD